MTTFSLRLCCGMLHKHCFVSSDLRIDFRFFRFWFWPWLGLVYYSVRPADSDQDFDYSPPLPHPPPHKRIRILAPLYSSASCHLYPEARPSWNWYLQCCGSGIRDCVPFWPLYAGSSMNNPEDNLMSLKGIFWFVCGIRDGDSSDPVTVMVESRIRDKHLPDPPHWVPVNTCSGFKLILPLWFRYRIHQPSKSGTKAWYRCTSYSSNKCRATAVLRKSTNTLIKVTRPHNHSPGFLPDFAR